MKEQPNRIEQQMELWLAKEQRFGKLFSTAVLKSSDFQKEKLAYLEDTRRQFKGQLSPDERLTMRVLNRERSRIEKQLFPNLLVRLGRRGVLAAVRYVVRLRDERKLSLNERQLKEQMAAIGFGRNVPGLREQMSQGKAAFQMPVSWYRNEKEQLSFDLHFKKESNGAYKMESFNAAVKDEAAGKVKAQSFRVDNKELTAQQAANLLSGRAVEKDGKWLQLDLNDKDGQGKFKMKQFHPGYGYDLLKAVQQLPIRELKNGQSKEELLSNLRNGDRQEVTARINGKDRKLAVEANPQFKSVNVFDEQGKKLSLVAALGQQVKQELKVVHSQRAVKSNRLAIGS